VATLPLLLPLGRMFFHNADEFADDTGLSERHGILNVISDLLRLEFLPITRAPERGVYLNILWFVLVWAASVTAAYHIFVFALSRIT
jgi:hypothetical protein